MDTPSTPPPGNGFIGRMSRERARYLEYARGARGADSGKAELEFAKNKWQTFQIFDTCIVYVYKYTVGPKKICIIFTNSKSFRVNFCRLECAGGLVLVDAYALKVRWPCMFNFVHFVI